ncbi:MAG: hypothetical protein JNL08_00145 [Planctomycetes bacterium]|nr:hypothetical protein [Planctomycetota bacterium]
MFRAKSILSASFALLTLTSATLAQGLYTSQIASVASTGAIWVPVTPPTLPPVESRAGGYDRSIGNDWLGGSVHAYAGMVRQKQGTYELGHAAVEFRATAKVLKQGLEVAEVVGSLMNVMNNGVQNRSGYCRFDVLGWSIYNGSFQNNSTFASATSLFNLFGSSGVSASVPVGPVSVSLSGNAGCGFSRSANWLLPAATASVGANATASAHAFANAQVGIGIPGFGLGVGLQGKILEQSLTANLNANANWGLSGGCSYTLKGITLTLYAWAQAIWTWTTNLCSWSSGQVVLNLI